MEWQANEKGVAIVKARDNKVVNEDLGGYICLKGAHFRDVTR